MSIAFRLDPGSLQLMHCVEQASALQAAVVFALFVYLWAAALGDSCHDCSKAQTFLFFTLSVY